ARVEPEPRPQQSHLAAVEPDLPQHPRLAERPVAAEEVVVQRPDALRDRPVEATNLLEHRLRHSLTLVRELPRRQRPAIAAVPAARRTTYSSLSPPATSFRAWGSTLYLAAMSVGASLASSWLTSSS